MNMRKDFDAPNFLLIGAHKSGTSALYYLLRKHPEIYMPNEKEPNYFSNVCFSGAQMNSRGRYKSYLDYKKIFKHKNEKAVGEATTNYMDSELAADNICKFNSAMKILAIIRQPAERAYSHYNHAIKYGIEQEKSFLRALEFEETRIQNGAGKMLWYKRRGYYYEHLRRYFSRFPREQIKIVLYDDFCKNDSMVMKEIFSFLGVEQTVNLSCAYRHNKGGWPKSGFGIPLKIYNRIRASDMIRKFIPISLKHRIRDFMIAAPASLSAEMKMELTHKYFLKDIQQLSQLIKKDLDFWLC